MHDAVGSWRKYVFHAMLLLSEEDSNRDKALMIIMSRMKTDPAQALKVKNGTRCSAWWTLKRWATHLFCRNLEEECIIPGNKPISNENNANTIIWTMVAFGDGFVRTQTQPFPGGSNVRSFYQVLLSWKCWDRYYPPDFIVVSFSCDSKSFRFGRNSFISNKQSYWSIGIQIRGFTPNICTWSLVEWKK